MGSKLRMDWHWQQIIEVEDYLFAPHFKDWGGRVENTMEITYTPIFRTGKN